MDAIDWNTARFTTNIPIRVDSEKFAASIRDGPLWYALYPSYPTSLYGERRAKKDRSKVQSNGSHVMIVVYPVR